MCVDIIPCVHVFIVLQRAHLVCVICDDGLAIQNPDQEDGSCRQYVYAHTNLSISLQTALINIEEYPAN